jgi:hypothetical protein
MVQTRFDSPKGRDFKYGDFKSRGSKSRDFKLHNICMNFNAKIENLNAYGIGYGILAQPTLSAMS